MEPAQKPSDQVDLPGVLTMREREAGQETKINLLESKYFLPPN